MPKVHHHDKQEVAPNNAAFENIYIYIYIVTKIKRYKLKSKTTDVVINEGNIKFHHIRPVSSEC